jgi:hypothetical protein
LRTLLHTLPLLLGATVLGCQEDPSFRVRWAIDPSLSLGEASKPGLASPADCSSAGVLDVRITTRDAFGVIVDSRKRPCFSSQLESPEGSVAGPELPPGPYAVEIRGVRRDGVVWSDVLSPLDELEPDPGCVPDLSVSSSEQDPSCSLDSLVCDCAFVEVAEGRTVHLDDVVLDAPPQCQDGVDNDGDGLVDMFDPACRLGRMQGQLYAREDVEVVANAQLVIRPSLLHDNPVATCAGLGISRFLVTFDDGPTLAEPICGEVLRRVFQASAMITPGETHVVRVVAVDFGRQPLTVAKEVVIEAPAAGGGRFTMDVDFGPQDFLEPIVAPTELIPRFSPFEDAGGFTRACTPENYAGGRLWLTDLRMRLLGSRGKPLPTPAELSDETPLDGATPIACTANILRTEPLAWGEHMLEVEALSPEGEVCFSNVGSPMLTAPGQTILTIPRVFPVPESCHDCTTDADCVDPGGTANTAVCDAGICRPTCDADGDCPSGTRCSSGLCSG